MGFPIEQWSVCKMNGDERGKGKKVVHLDEKDLRLPFLLPPEILTDSVEASVHAEQNDVLQTSPLQVAALLVEQAMKGRWMPIEVAHHKNFGRAKQAFLLYHKLYAPRAICILALVALPCFEIPVWCQGHLPYPCGDPVKYQLSGFPYIERWQSLLIESLCLIMLTCSVALQYYYYMGSGLWKHRSVIVKVVMLTALLISAAASAAGVAEASKLSMYLRVLVPVAFTRALRVCFRMTTRIIHTFADIAVLLGLFILVSAYIATVMFRDTISEYKDYRTSLLNLFVLLTTANNPNIWADAYTADRRVFFFFFTYLVVGLFFLMNLVFTVIYNNYKAQMATEVEKRTTARQQCLRAAFTMLDTRQQNWIDGATMTALLHTMSSYSQIPDFSNNNHEVFLALDKRGDFRIWQDEFEGLCDVVAMEIERQRQHRSRAELVLHVITETRIFTESVYDLTLWFLTFASVAIAVCESEVTSNYIKNKLAIVEIVLVWVFVMDVLIKLRIQGWTKYWRVLLNQFDFLLTSLTSTLQTAVFFHLAEQHWVSILILVRGLRVCCFMAVVSRWHLMAQTVIHLIPATAPILTLQFTVCTLFSLLGVHLFGGQVYVDNRLLEGTEYASGRLYAFNYNDYASAMVTSFNLCIVNNWYVIMDAYAIVTGTAWSRAFFVTFWAVAVAFTLNVVVAFFVEAFVFRMERAETKMSKEPQPSRSTSRSESPTRGRSRGRRALTIPRMYSCYDLYEDILKK